MQCEREAVAHSAACSTACSLRMSKQCGTIPDRHSAQHPTLTSTLWKVDCGGGACLHGGQGLDAAAITKGCRLESGVLGSGVLGSGVLGSGVLGSG